MKANYEKKSGKWFGVVAGSLLMCAGMARAEQVSIYGPDADKFMTSLESMGVLSSFDNNGGFVMQLKELDCYVPVVPNPKANCFALEATESGETFDDSRESRTVYNMLVNYGASYDDGSVGASKAGLFDVSCYRLISTGETSCTGRTKM